MENRITIFICTDTSTSPPTIDPWTPNTIFPLLPDRDIVTGLQLGTEFCVSFKLMLRYVPDTQHQQPVLLMTSGESATLLSLEVRQSNLLGVNLLGENITVREDFLNIHHSTGLCSYALSCNFIFNQLSSRI